MKRYVIFNTTKGFYSRVSPEGAEIYSKDINKAAVYFKRQAHIYRQWDEKVVEVQVDIRLA